MKLLITIVPFISLNGFCQSFSEEGIQSFEELAIRANAVERKRKVSLYSLYSVVVLKIRLNFRRKLKLVIKS